MDLQGRYCDEIMDGAGRVVLSGGWHRNRVTTSAWQVIAGLLAGVETKGIRALAMGGGDESWDGDSSMVTRDRKQLAAELNRVELRPEDIQYVGGTPSAHVEATTTVLASTRMVLREMGLIGGTEQVLLNYIVHAKLPLEADTPLHRSIRLSLPFREPALSVAAPHALAAGQVELLRLPTNVAALLRRANVVTIGGVSTMPVEAVGVLTIEQVAAARGLALAALRVAADLVPADGLTALTLQTLLTESTAELAKLSFEPMAALDALKRDIALLFANIDPLYLASLTLDQIVRGPLVFPSGAE